MKLAFETRYKVRLGSTHPLMLWLVEHASFLLSKFQLNTDGRTGWGRLHGRETRERICEFGECVLWYVPKRMRAKLDARWRHGVFLGRSMNSDSNFIGLRDGSVVCARAMVRLVPERRWNLELVSNVTGVPMDMKTKSMDLIETQVNPHEHEAMPEQTEKQVKARRQLKITGKDLRLHGYTATCPRFSLHQQGQHARANYLRHSEDCRTRMYEAMRLVGAEKMTQADAEGEF